MGKKILAGFLLIIFTIILPPTAVLFNAKAILLNPELIKKIINESDVYKELTGYLNESFKKSLEESFSKQKFAPEVEVLQKELFSRDFLPESFIKKAGEAVIDGFIGFLKGEKNRLEAMVSIAELKEANPFFAGSLSRGEKGEVPDEINLFEYLLGQGLLGETELAYLPGLIQKIILGLYVAVAVLFFLFISICLLVLKPLKSLFRWAGTAFLLPGVILFLASLIGKALITQGKMVLIQGKTEEVPKEMVEEALGLIAAFQKVIFKLIEILIAKNLIWAAVFAGIGIVLIIISFFFKKKWQEEVAVSEPKEKTPEVASATEATIIRK